MRHRSPRGRSLLEKGTGKLLRDIKKGKPFGAFPFLYLTKVLWFFLSRKNSPAGLRRSNPFFIIF